MNCERTITNLLPPRKAGAVRILGDRVLPHNVPDEEPPPPFGVEPRSRFYIAPNRAWARTVAARLALIADTLPPLQADPPTEWACLRCGDDVADPSECWCAACAADLRKGT